MNNTKYLLRSVSLALVCALLTALLIGCGSSGGNGGGASSNSGSSSSGDTSSSDSDSSSKSGLVSSANQVMVSSAIERYFTSDFTKAERLNSEALLLANQYAVLYTPELYYHDFTAVSITVNQMERSLSVTFSCPPAYFALDSSGTPDLSELVPGTVNLSSLEYYVSQSLGELSPELSLDEMEMTGSYGYAIYPQIIESNGTSYILAAIVMKITLDIPTEDDDGNSSSSTAASSTAAGA